MRDSVDVPQEVQDEVRFREEIKRLRKKNNWLQKDLADKMVEAGYSDYSQTTVSRLESGHRPLTLSESRAIAKIFRVPLTEMLAGTSEAPRKIQDLSKALGRAEREWQALIASTRELAKLRFQLSCALQALDDLGLDPESIASNGYSAKQIDDLRQESISFENTDDLLLVIKEFLNKVPENISSFEDDEPDWNVFNELRDLD